MKKQENRRIYAFLIFVALLCTVMVSGCAPRDESKSMEGSNEQVLGRAVAPPSSEDASNEDISNHTDALSADASMDESQNGSALDIITDESELDAATSTQADQNAPSPSHGDASKSTAVSNASLEENASAAPTPSTANPEETAPSSPAPAEFNEAPDPNKTADAFSLPRVGILIVVLFVLVVLIRHFQQKKRMET